MGLWLVRPEQLGEANGQLAFSLAILISVAPFLFPVLIQLLGLLTGLIQAYIFAVLAMVYIASATRAHAGEPPGADGGAR